MSNDCFWGETVKTLRLVGFDNCDIEDIPYAPFSRADRIHKIADWNSVIPQEKDGIFVLTSDEKIATRKQRAAVDQAPAFALYSMLDSINVDDASFLLVDRSQLQPPQTSSRRLVSRTAKTNPNARVTLKKDSQGVRNQQSSQNKKWYDKSSQKLRDASLIVGHDWKMIEEIEFVRLSKLYLDVDDPLDIAAFGSCQFYDKTYDKVTAKADKKLNAYEKSFFNTSASSDPILTDLSKKVPEEEKHVFVTDVVLSALMCASKSVYSWDLVITKRDNVIFIDKRDGGYFDVSTVNENAGEPPSDDKDTTNSPFLLAQECTLIGHNYSQQVLLGREEGEFKLQPSPYESLATPDAPLPSNILRYRKWDLGNSVSLTCRLSIDAVISVPKSESPNLESSILFPDGPEDKSDLNFVSVKTLNEFDTGATNTLGTLDWKRKIDTQRGSVMITEIKNNNSKLSRWTAEAILASCDLIKIGFVTRVVARDRTKHSIVGSVTLKPDDFADQIGLSIGSGWGVVRAVCDLVFGWDDGKYVMLKDPNRPMFRMYSVPMSTFEVAETDE